MSFVFVYVPKPRFVIAGSPVAGCGPYGFRICGPYSPQLQDEENDVA